MTMDPSLWLIETLERGFIYSWSDFELLYNLSDLGFLRANFGFVVTLIYNNEISTPSIPVLRAQFANLLALGDL
jgi:hypothetical protein